MNKVRATVDDALSDLLRDGMSIMSGGFGLSGNPEALIRGVIERGVRNLTLVSNNAVNLGKGLALWLKAGIVLLGVRFLLGDVVRLGGVSLACVVVELAASIAVMTALGRATAKRAAASAASSSAAGT